jgi:hypothetical protein
MSGWHVERLAGSDDFVVVGVVNCHLSLEHISPVWALAAVVGQALQHRRKVSVLANGHEVDGVAIGFLGPFLADAKVTDLLRRFSLIPSTCGGSIPGSYRKRAVRSTQYETPERLCLGLSAMAQVVTKNSEPFQVIPSFGISRS